MEGSRSRRRVCVARRIRAAAMRGKYGANVKAQKARVPLARVEEAAETADEAERYRPAACANCRVSVRCRIRLTRPSSPNVHRCISRSLMTLPLFFTRSSR